MSAKKAHALPQGSMQAFMTPAQRPIMSYQADTSFNYNKQPIKCNQRNQSPEIPYKSIWPRFGLRRARRWFGQGQDGEGGGGVAHELADVGLRITRSVGIQCGPGPVFLPGVEPGDALLQLRIIGRGAGRLQLRHDQPAAQPVAG